MEKIEAETFPEGTFVIREALEDGHSYVRVSNWKGEHLFCMGTYENAEKKLMEDHRVDVAATWNDITLAPKLKIEFIPLK
jgi:hypothetical protein